MAWFHLWRVCVAVCWYHVSKRKKNKIWFVAFANFHGVHISTMIYFHLHMWGPWTPSWEATGTVDSCKPVQTGTCTPEGVNMRGCEQEVSSHIGRGRTSNGASRWQSWDLNPALSHSQAHAFNPCIVYAFVHTIQPVLGRFFLSSSLSENSAHPSRLASVAASFLKPSLYHFPTPITLGWVTERHRCWRSALSRSTLLKTG